MGRPCVVIVGPTIGGAGGIAVVTETLLESSLAARFELVHVATHADSGAIRKSLVAFAGIARVAFRIATRKADLVYLHTSSGFSLRRKATVAMLARLGRCAYVVHVHGSDFDGYYRAAHAWERWLVRLTLSRAALVIAVAPAWEKRLQAIVACRTVAIPNLVAIPPQQALIDPAHRRIVCLGRLGDRKGSRTLVQALALLAGDRPDLRLLLAGDGDIASVRDEARRVGVAEPRETPGWIDAEARRRALLAATVFALPAREEGLPVALLEAMAYGIPAVVSPVGGIPDYFEDGLHGYLVPPDDSEALAEALARLLDDLDLARRMGVRARADAAAHFAADVVAVRVGDALESALAHHRREDEGRSTT